ncbi:MAG: T9SS type A sorting domain-containing protein [Vicingaceae bacterium]
MKRYIVSLFSIFLALSSLNAQELEWVGQLTGNNDQTITDLEVEPITKNIYVCGYFNTEIEFNLFSNSNFITPNGSSDIFLAKYDSIGTLLWSQTFGGNANDLGRDLNLTNDGYIYLAGEFASTVDFNPSSQNSFTLTSNGNLDVFISKFDTSGNWVWTNSFGNVNSETTISVTSDTSGNVYLGGGFKGSLDFTPNSNGGSISSFSNNHFYGYIASYQSNGNFRWAKPQGVDYPSRHDVYKLKFNSNSDLFAIIKLNDNSVNRVRGNVNSYKAIRLAKIDRSTGNNIWNQDIHVDSTYLSGLSQMYILDFEFDQSGNIYLGGNFGGSVDLDGSSNTHLVKTINNGNHYASILIKYDPQGTFIWSNQHRRDPNVSFSNSFIQSLDIKGNKILTTGSYAGSHYLDSSKSKDILPFFGDRDIFTASYNTQDGSLSSQAYFGANGYDIGQKAVYLTEKQAIFAGQFGNSVSFNPEDSTQNILNAFGGDAYIQRLSFCPKNFASLTETACNDYFSPSGKKYTSTGVYSDTLINNLGCDSIVTIDLTINPIDTSISRLGDQIIVGESGSNVFYQWVDCNNNYASIPGESAQSFTPSKGGRYAVIVLKNGCQDTSECVLSTVGLSENSIFSQMEVFPNPTKNNLNVEIDQEGIFNYQLFDLNGKLVRSGDVKEGHLNIKKGDLSGLYHLKIMSQYGQSAFRKVTFID